MEEKKALVKKNKYKFLFEKNVNDNETEMFILTQQSADLC